MTPTSDKAAKALVERLQSTLGLPVDYLLPIGAYALEAAEPIIREEERQHREKLGEGTRWSGKTKDEVIAILEGRLATRSRERNEARAEASREFTEKLLGEKAMQAVEDRLIGWAAADENGCRFVGKKAIEAALAALDLARGEAALPYGGRSCRCEYSDPQFDGREYEPYWHGQEECPVHRSGTQPSQEES